MAETRLQTIVALALLIISLFPFVDYQRLERGRIAEYNQPKPIAAAVAGRWDLERIEAYAAWQAIVERAGVVVAVLDTGIDETHPALSGKVIEAVNFSRSDTSDDINGHGTHVAGVIAAAVQDGGTPGVAFDARLLNVKIAGDDGMADQAALAQGLTWAAEHGAQVINISVVFNKPDPAVQSAIRFAQDRGAVVVAAAGNSFSTQPRYPAAYPGVIGVGATGKDDAQARWSNRGEWLTVVAPGVEIYATLPGEGYGWKGGTSAAAALVSGEAALLFATRGEGIEPRTEQQVRQAIIDGAEFVAGNETARVNVLHSVMAIP